MDTPNRPFQSIKYVLPNGVNVILTSRPDVYEKAEVLDFIKTHDPIVRFQFTDDPVKIEFGPPIHWYPWIPLKNLPVELVWAATYLLHQYVESEGIHPRTIWLHCDSSTMRAPTFFGLFLRMFYPNEMESIVSAAQWSDPKRYHSSPVYYSQISLERDQGVAGLVEAWQTGGYSAAYEFVMKNDRWT